VTPLVVAEARCSVDFQPEWPLSQDRGADEGAVSQPLADSGGSVFLHYGPASTLEAYIGGWQERYRDGAHVTADGPVATADGLEGRRLALALDEQTMTRMGAPRRTTPAQTLVCHGYTIRSLPVLLGYLVPQAADDRIVATAERIIGSLRVT
jgi:hypothetical protein